MSGVERYGVKMTTPVDNLFDVNAEEVRLLGYTTLDAGFTSAEMDTFSALFQSAESNYAAQWKGHDLGRLNEADAIRLLPVISPEFWAVAFNENLLQLLSRLLGDYFILNQVNGLVNRGNGSKYHQAKYHRDLPYQHFTSSRPLAINALFALDDFTLENGATRVIPASHHREAFPPDQVVTRVEQQVTVKRGTYVILDCMLYHAGASNTTNADRRAINHVFTIPLMRQQFHLPSILGPDANFTIEQRKILGYDLEEFRSLHDWFTDRKKRTI